MGKVNFKFKKAEARILSLLELEDGWDYGEGVKIDEDNVWLAIAIIRELDDEYIKSIDGFPMDDGLIDLKIFLKNNVKIGLFIDVEVGEITSYVETEGIHSFEVVKIEGVKKHIQEKIERYKKNVICGTIKKHMQDYYTRDIFQARMDSISYQFLSLGRPAAGAAGLKEGYHSLILSAHAIKTAGYAGMSKPMRIRTAGSERIASSGSLTQSSYHRIAT